MTAAAILLTLLSVILSATVPRPVDLFVKRKAKKRARAQQSRVDETRMLLTGCRFDKTAESGYMRLTGTMVRVPRQRQGSATSSISPLPRHPTIHFVKKGKPGARFNARRCEIRVRQRLVSEAPEGVAHAVIAHESGHFINRDAVGWWRYATGLASVTLAAGLGAAATVGPSLAPPSAIAVSAVYVYVVWLPHCRRNELAAGVASLRLVPLADAVAACEWMAAFRRKIPTWISAHPSTANQIKALKAADPNNRGESPWSSA